MTAIFEVMLIVLVFVFSFQVASTSADEVCPEGCKCDSNYQQVDCDGLGLTSLQQLETLPTTVQTLHISSNQLRDLNLTGFHVPNLRAMFARNNDFIELPKIYASNAVLQSFDVQDNFLLDIETDILAELTNLETINLKNNSLSNIPVTSLKNLKSLQEIIISENNLTSAKIDTDMSDHTNLSNIHFDGNEGITQIENDDFAALESGLDGLTLILSKCAISSIDENAFDPISHRMHTLSLSGNPLTPEQLVPALAKDFEQLTTLELSSLNLESFAEIDGIFSGNKSSLQVVDLSNNSLTDLKGAGNFSELENLMTLTLHHNKLAEFSLDLSQPFPKLSVLDISYNELKEIPNDLNSISRELLSLDLSSNQINNLEEMASSESLQTILLNENQIQNINGSFCSNFPTLFILSISENIVSTVDRGAFSGCPDLFHIDLGRNLLTAYIPYDTFSNAPNLKYLNLTSNNISDITDKLFNMPNVETLDLSNNKISMLTPNSLSGCTHLNFLNLRSNMLTAKMISVDTFSSLNNLNTLILSQNQLGDLPDKIFDLPQLQTIELSTSKITSLSPQTFGKGSTKPHIIYMEDNSIKVVSEELLKSISGKLTRINFSKNPYNCSCDLLYFRDWLNSTRSNPDIVVIDIYTPGAYTCESPEKRKHEAVTSFNTDEGECDGHVSPTIHPMEYHGLSSGEIVAIVLGVLVLSTILFAAFWLLAKRWRNKTYSEIS